MARWEVTRNENHRSGSKSVGDEKYTDQNSGTRL